MCVFVKNITHKCNIKENIQKIITGCFFINKYINATLIHFINRLVTYKISDNTFVIIRYFLVNINDAEIQYILIFFSKYNQTFTKTVLVKH